MAKSNTHLHFNGNCLEAFKFYEKCLGGKIAFSMTWGEAPMETQVSKDWNNKILHACVEFEGQKITGDDVPPERYSKPQGFEIMVSYLDVKQGEKVFNALSEGGKVTMPYGKTFWAKGFGMVTDKFGIPWMINVGDEK